MRVGTWIDLHTDTIKNRPIRVVDAKTHKGLGCHWIAVKDFDVENIKITSRFIFIFVR